MRILSLYIDKWYVVGTIMDGANRTPLSLSNAEDRIWLYFYSNSTTNAVKYSISYKDEALAGEKGYYADVFELLPDYKEYHYEKYGARKKMSEIFTDAEIFSDIRKSYGDDSNIPVYVSFSEDIDLVARGIFLETLKNERFDVLQYTLPIENLVLEYLIRHGKIADDDQKVLVVNACNENLRYSIYDLHSNALSVVSQKCEPGYGVDSRKQAVVEEVMEYMQADTHFLTGANDELQEEMLYLSQFADLWLKKIDNSSDTAPVALGNIHFKKQANNEVPVVVSAYNLNDRTKNIIGKLTGKIVDMIKESGVLLHQISNIVFLGDVFSNRAFTDSLQRKIGVASDNVTLISDLTLPEIVAVYDKWEQDAFDEEKKKFLESARNKYTQDRNKYVEQQTHELKEKAQAAEENGRLQDALDIYVQVLRIDGNDNFSKARIEAIHNQMEEIRKIREQIDGLLEKARQSFLAGDFTDAIRNCDDILRLQNDNSDAKKMKEDAEDVLKRRELLERYIDNMDELIMKSRFFDANNILQKVDELNVNDIRLKEIRDKIETGIAKLQLQVQDKSLAYETAFQAGDYQQCLRLCDELLTIGADSSVWTGNRQVVMEKIRQEHIFQDNYELARKARLEHEWNKVVEYAEKALKIKYDEEAKSMLQEANTRLSEMLKKKEFENEMDKIEKLITINKNDKAESRLKSLENSLKRDGVIDGYMEMRIKIARMRLFDFEQPTARADGGTKSPPHNQLSDDFDWETMKIRNVGTSANTKLEYSKSNKIDDFFDSVESESKSQQKRRVSKPTGKITNDDFNF